MGSPQLCTVVTGSLRNLERCVNERGCCGEARNYHGESVWFSVDVTEMQNGYRTVTVGVTPCCSNCSLPLYFSTHEKEKASAIPPSPSIIPCCTDVQFSRDSIRAFNDRIKYEKIGLCE